MSQNFTPPLPIQNLRTFNHPGVTGRLFSTIKPVIDLFAHLGRRASQKQGGVSIYAVSGAVRDSDHGLALESIPNIDMILVMPPSAQSLPERAQNLSRLAAKEISVINLESGGSENSPHPRFSFAYQAKCDYLGRPVGSPLRFNLRLLEGEMAARDLACYGYAGISHIVMGQTGRIMVSELYNADSNDHTVTAAAVPPSGSEQNRLVQHVGRFLARNPLYRIRTGELAGHFPPQKRYGYKPPVNA